MGTAWGANDLMSLIDTIQLGTGDASDASDASAWDRLTDEEFLRAVRWDDEADAKAARRAADGDRDGLLRSLRKTCFGLGRRADRKAALKHRVAAAPALWSRGAFPDEPPHVERLIELRSEGASPGGEHSESWTRKLATLRKLTAWSRQLTSETPPTVYERLLSAEVLRHARAVLPADLLWSLWRRLLTASAGDRGGDDAADALPADARLIVEGELPWITGLFFGGVAGAAALRDAGREALRRHLEEGTDGDGTPRADLLPRLPSWLGSLTRAAEWAVAADVPLWDDESDERFTDLVERSAALLTPDGRVALSAGCIDAAPVAVPVLVTAASLAGFRKSEPLTGFLHALQSDAARNGSASAARNGAAVAVKTVKAVAGDADVQGGFQSDWAELACLRGGWTKSSALIAVAHDAPQPRLALSARGQSWLAGTWELELSIGGEVVSTDGWEWTCVCWFTDEDVDYLELQCERGGSLRIERQVLLSRSQDFAVLADCVGGTGLGEFTYRSRLPLAAGARAEPDAATREWRLAAGPQRPKNRKGVRVFPLSVPDERVLGTPGSFRLVEGEPDQLESVIPAVGGLFAPVVLDWKGTRRESRADWRRLTVTEDGRKVGGERAGGYRLRIGDYQLLLYRSLTADDDGSRGLRAVLGHHTGHETVIGRFDRTGTVHPLLLVE
jgi:hypothetical protein